ncbi:uncharacterized protein LOC112456763 [Temnothorax curvispinosus]|uniref:Uncharacterized protein LOC112456763 n=1 Tax=Temnothorax curvispinosus TaxID=300111 RepID=A0A6J1Q0R5_9HYME|nr:uncharacterized protein LOC112456763 [Temnothorax curvispinosus]
MRIIVLVAFVMAVLASVSAQDFRHFFRGFGPYGGISAAIMRDPRSNRGPVLFPPGPPDTGETSGVIVGASGYGFVPPGSGYFTYFYY